MSGILQQIRDKRQGGHPNNAAADEIERLIGVLGEILEIAMNDRHELRMPDICRVIRASLREMDYP